MIVIPGAVGQLRHVEVACVVVVVEVAVLVAAAVVQPRANALLLGVGVPAIYSEAVRADADLGRMLRAGIVLVKIIETLLAEWIPLVEVVPIKLSIAEIGFAIGPQGLRLLVYRMVRINWHSV